MANRFAGTLSKLFKLGVQRAIVEASPVQILIPPGGFERPRDRVLSDEELTALLACLNDVFIHARRTAAAIRLILYTACRRSEIALAKWSHFRLDGDAPLWTVPEELSKTGVKYLIPLVPAAVAELRDKQRKERQRLAGRFPTLDEWLQRNRRTDDLAQVRGKYPGSILGTEDRDEQAQSQDIRAFLAEVRGSTVDYHRGDHRAVFTDLGRRIEVHGGRDQDDLTAALQLAAQK